MGQLLIGTHEDYFHVYSVNYRTPTQSRDGKWPRKTKPRF